MLIPKTFATPCDTLQWSNYIPYQKFWLTHCSQNWRKLHCSYSSISKYSFQFKHNMQNILSCQCLLSTAFFQSFVLVTKRPCTAPPPKKKLREDEIDLYNSREIWEASTTHLLDCRMDILSNTHIESCLGDFTFI